MTTLEIQLDDDVVALLGQSLQPPSTAVKEMIVVELYRRGTISSGKAGELLGVPRFEFIRRTEQLGIPFYEMSEGEWHDERERNKPL